MSGTTMKRTLTRRTVLQAGAAATLVPALGPILPAAGQQPPPRGPLQVDVDQGNVRPRPIAIPPFLGDDPRFAAEVAAVVTADLESSGLFVPLDPAGFIERIGDLNATPRFADWRSSGAEALVVGRVSQLGDGRVRAEFRLWDVVIGKQLTGQQFTTAVSNWRRVGHILADQVWEKLTLEKGYFDSRIVFIDETGPKQKRVKRLAIMDQDGHNTRLLSQGGELVLTPRFSPTTQEITYMSYAAGSQPRVVMLNIDTGQRGVVGDFPGMTFAPRFSPDGQRIVMSLQQEGDSSILEMDLRSRQMRRLTQGRAIDTGPCYSPDGRQIVFESDREGASGPLCDGVGWFGPTANQPRRGPLLDARVVPTRRLHRIHQAGLGALPHRRPAPRWLRGAHTHGWLSQRRTDLGAERTLSDVLQGTAWRQRGAAHLLD
jgi:TolB protein